MKTIIRGGNEMKKWLFIFTFFTALLFVAGCNSNGVDGNSNDYQVGDESKDQEGSQQDTVSLQLLNDESVGQYLADSKGMTLYYFTADKPGVSSCSGDCLVNWPAFVEQDFEVPEGFNKDDFGTITREDTGEVQVTYKEYPLYYFIKDKAKGDVTGQGINNVWFIVNTDTSF